MAKAQKREGSKEYVLKFGHEHNGFDSEGNRHTFVGGQEGNDRVFLTDSQAKAFADKFESLEERNERMKAQNELQEMKAKEAKLREVLQDKGIDLDELLADKDATIKKPDPTPSVGTQEPAPKNVTPAPVGSTANPVAPDNGKSGAGEQGNTKK